MEKDKEIEVLLNKCLNLVMEKLNWGSSELWTTKDFEILSEKIFQETKVNLSLATLKRLWGKMKYNSKPTITTLDAIARFATYQNWRDFVQSQSLSNGSSHVHQNSHDKNAVIEFSAEADSADFKEATKYFLSRKSRYFIISSMILVTVLISFLWLTRKTDKRQYDTSRFSFSSRKVVSESVPNSVVFSYDAHAASPTDTILIQQSWDKRLQQQVFYNQKQATSIYYYPGFFKAKLLVNGQVVKEHNLIINTNGWLPLIKRGNNIPIYFKEENALTGEALHLPIEKLLASNVSLQPEVPTVEYYNVRSFADLQSDDFKFEAVLKNSFREGTAACQQTNVQILCEGNFISIPLSTKGCISDLSLFFLGNKKDGKKEDLSDFGCDFSSWVNLRCEVKNKMCFIYINDKLVYEATLQAVPEKITGIVFSFEGTGSVDMVKLSKSDGSIIYSENFEN